MEFSSLLSLLRFSSISIKLKQLLKRQTKIKKWLIQTYLYQKIVPNNKRNINTTETL